MASVITGQTVASGSQLVQRDRKGMNVAIGPMGFSIGNRSFVKWDLKRINYNLQRCPATVVGEPDLSALPRFVKDTKLVVEPLSIGNWCAISGAAFTTGHGKGTTLGLSLLLALTNVRVGYWWNAEVEPPEPQVGDRSRCGGNARENRVAICAAHHQHGLHRRRGRGDWSD